MESLLASKMGAEGSCTHNEVKPRDDALAQKSDRGIYAATVSPVLQPEVDLIQRTSGTRSGLKTAVRQPIDVALPDGIVDRMSAQVLKRFPGILALFLLPLLANAWKPSPPVSAEFVKLGFYPLQLEADTPVPLIWGTVNRNRALLLVDTGFTFTTMDRTVVPEFEPVPAEAARQMGPLLGPSAGTNWFVIRRLTLSRAEFLNLPARILDLRIGHEEQSRQNGVLGVDFLKQYHALIFCGEGRLLLPGHSGEQLDSKQLEEILRSAGYTEVAMEISPAAVWMVPARIEATEFKLLVDTGATRTLLDADFAKELKVRARGFGTKVSGVENRETKARRATVHDLQIGSFSAPDSKLMLGNAKLWNPGYGGKLLPRFSESFASLRGMLGYDLLKEYAAVIDCHGGKLWLHARAK